MSEPGRLFLEASRTYLATGYLPRIRKAVAELEPAEVWWRPNEASNSIGNLLLHLAGNIRQWIVHGVGGAEDVRERQAEFDAREGDPPAELLDHLEAAAADAVAVLDGLDPSTLSEHRTIQGMETTVLGAIYHVVEHLSMHTGQVLWIVKARTGEDLGFYRIGQDGTAEEGW
jgi:uncharacterized damage-inducible protein DinB